MKISFKNAVLFKDMQMKAKRPQMPVMILVFNLILAIVSFIVMFAINANVMSYSAVSSRTMIYLLMGLVIAEAVVIGFMIPSITAGLIAGERERQTLDVLMTTRLSSWEIVSGKYWSSIVYIILLLVSGLPTLSLVFIYGGISFWDLLVLMFVIVTVAMFLASFGVFFSTLLKKTITATVLTYLSFFVIMGATIIIVAIAIVIEESMNSYYLSQYRQGLVAVQKTINLDAFIFLMYSNPLTTAYDVIMRIFGADFGSGYSNGMTGLMMEFTDYKETNILLRFWTPISIGVQLTLAWLILKGTAAILRPGKKKKRERKKGDGVVTEQ